MGTKNNPGEFDCYENADPDEPMFILLARDPDAAMLVRLWANIRERVTLSKPILTLERERGLAKVTEARACADAMEAWRKEHRP